MKNNLSLITILIICCNISVAQIFTKNTTLDIVTAAEVTGSSWVDYDNDGDLDVLPSKISDLVKQ